MPHNAAGLYLDAGLWWHFKGYIYFNDYENNRTDYD